MGYAEWSFYAPAAPMVTASRLSEVAVARVRRTRPRYGAQDATGDREWTTFDSVYATIYCSVSRMFMRMGCESTVDAAHLAQSARLCSRCGGSEFDSKSG